MSNVIKHNNTFKPLNEFKVLIQEPFITEDVEEEVHEEIKVSYEDEVRKIEEFLEQAKKEADKKRREADAYAHKVYEEIEQEKQRALEEMKQKEQEAMEQGYNEGYHSGFLDGKQSYQEKIEDAQRIVDLAEQDYKNAVCKSEETIIEIACSVANKVVTSSVLEDDVQLSKLIKAAIKQVKECHNIKIRISPTHYDRILKYKSEFEEIMTTNNQVYLIPDDELDELSCYIETETGRLDIGVDTQFYQLRNKLIELVQGEA